MPEILEDSSAGISDNVLFGKYELGRLLGHGGFGKVYHAREVRTGQSVAIKVISKRKIVKSGLAGNVKREISIMQRLRHPHIIKLLEVMASKSKIYFVMEFAKGGEFFTKIAKGRFSEDLSRRYFQQLIAAVGYCHSRGIYHRDLKPENLLLDENWSLKVSDFGLSAVTDQVRPDGMLHTLCGTPAYVAPEILSKKGYDGAKVDVWSCGIILYVLNAGYLPFNDTNLMNMYRKIYNGEYRCPKWMSPDLKRFLSRLLDTNPVTRITVDEIINDPWFRKDYKEIKFHEEFDDLKPADIDTDDITGADSGGGSRFINAFDLISISPGFNLSGLFVDPKKLSAKCTETFVTAENNILERIEAAAREADGGVTVAMKAETAVRLEGHGGNFALLVEVHRLTEELVWVEVRKRENGVGPSVDFWRDKLRPRISRFIYRPDNGPVAGGGEVTCEERAGTSEIHPENHDV